MPRRENAIHSPDVSATAPPRDPFDDATATLVRGPEPARPLAAVIRARDEADALRLANASAYGLGASLWTGDRERAERLTAELEAGCVFINAIVKSDPRMPFGGIKRSGYGRELSEFGLREFVNIKGVWLA